MQLYFLDSGSLHVFCFCSQVQFISWSWDEPRDQEGLVRVILTPSYSISQQMNPLGENVGILQVFRRYRDTISIQVTSMHLYINGIIFQLKKGLQLSQKSITHIRNFRGSHGKWTVLLKYAIFFAWGLFPSNFSMPLMTPTERNILFITPRPEIPSTNHKKKKNYTLHSSFL